MEDGMLRVTDTVHLCCCREAECQNDAKGERKRVWLLVFNMFLIVVVMFGFVTLVRSITKIRNGTERHVDPNGKVFQP